jgi:NitT/TauT family transport system permease protein
LSELRLRAGLPGRTRPKHGDASNTTRDAARRIRRRDRLIGIASPIALLVAWEAAARFGLIDTRFFPGPSSIVTALVAMLKSGELLANTVVSLKRLFWGFLLGGIPGLAIGVLMGIYRPLRASLEPLIAATYPIPKSAILPLILLIFGLGEMSKVVMVAIGAFYPIAINATAGVLEINQIYLDVGKSFKAGRWDMFRTIALPGALPFIMTGIKLGAGLALILIAIAEMVGAKSGLGFLVWNAWATFSVERMYVGLFAIAIIGFGLTFLLNELERWIIPWKSRT